MDQIKIGKFIASLRKEKDMTQLELATLLGITDRAISKWENGRGLPDISLIKPLCDALGISINELLCGEKIEKESIAQKADENIISTLTYSIKSIKKANLIFISVISSILLLVTVTVSCFFIDVNRMKNNLPVVFSTWGYDYAPPLNLQDELIELSVKDYLLSHGDGEATHYDNEKTFVAFRIYLLEETKKSTEYNVYAWILSENHYFENGNVLKDSGYSVPYKFVVQKQGEGFVVIDSRTPRDGSYYAEDMKNMFPLSVRKEMDNFYYDGTYERLQMDINEQLKLYFHIN